MLSAILNGCDSSFCSDDAIWRWTLGSGDGRSSSASTSTYVVDAMLDDGFYVGYYVVDAMLDMMLYA